MRRVIAFPCAGDTLAGTLDDAAGTTGLLIVSGGNEIRSGAHRGMAMLAARIAARGIPVFRFDRRGIGDSNGENAGFESSEPDLISAAAAFRTAAPHVARIVGFGNCDGATALALFHVQAGIDALVLANPWLGAQDDDLPPAAAIRARYAERLRDPATWRRLMTGSVDIAKLLRGLRKIARTETQVSLADRFAGGIGGVPVMLVLATRDATALAFAARWAGPVFAAIRARATTVNIATASHSFADPGDAAALEAAIIAALRPRPGPA